MAIYETDRGQQGEYDPKFDLPDPDFECESCIESNSDKGPEFSVLGQHAYVPRQFIMTGTGADLESVVAEAGLGIEPLMVLPLGTLLDGMSFPEQGEETGNPFLDPDRFDQGLLADLSINLYELPGDLTRDDDEILRQALSALREAVESRDRQGPVLVDLNYVTGFDISGAPWGVEGVPWGVEGVPWGVEGVAGGGPSATQANGHPFWNQWAFTGPHGIGLVDPFPTVQTLSAETGLQVRVGLFDTTPFAEEACYHFDGWLRYPPAGSAQGKAFVLHNWLPVHVLETIPRAADVDVDISDHGFFAAGLTYGVAPEAELHLVRVLNDRGQGDLHSLLRAMTWFTEEMIGCNDGQLHLIEERHLLAGTIYNLSLVARPDNEGEDLPQDIRDLIFDFADRFGYPHKPFPVVSLELMMQIITERGGVVVAAAGNDSYDKPDPLGPGLPAAYPNVVGVGATNNEGVRSCFSNTGDVYAPGGEGAPDGNDNCRPATHRCRNHPDFASCGFGVISVTARRPEPGFGIWVGTSFATPIVSGVAAQQLAARVPPGAMESALKPAAGSVVRIKP